jgi:hypothetical protein
LRSNGFIGASRQRGQFCAPRLPVPAHVEHQPAARSGFLGDCEPGELLQGVQGLAVRADERRQPRPDDRDDRPVVLDVQIDVAVVIDDVQEPLQVVGRNVALLDELGVRVVVAPGRRRVLRTVHLGIQLSVLRLVLLGLARIHRVAHCTGPLLIPAQRRFFLPGGRLPPPP